MEWTDTALVLHVGRFRESDMWLRLLSQHRGIFNVFAFGGSRSRKRFCGCLDLLNTVNCRIKTTRNGSYLALQEGVLLQGPQKLRKDYKRLGIVMNCVRFTEALGIGREGGSSAFSLLAKVMQAMESDHTFSPLLPLLFRLRLASEQGFAPSFDRCGVCGGAITGAATFLVNEGEVHCPQCMDRQGAYAVDIPARGLALLRTVQLQPLNCWDTASLSLTEKRACARAVDGFVQYHLGIAWENGRFKKV
ncbi:MAG: DNA repair protein RecO [Desulfovibrionaceae bacterium]